MNWEINIPYRDRDDPVSEIGFAARELPEDERAVVQRLTVDAITSGTETVGDFLDELEGLSEPERRQLLDRARGDAGLEPTGVIEQRREQRRIDARFSDHDIPGPPPWSPLQRCPQCGTHPTKHGGAWAEVSVEKWWCPEHRDQAAEGDMDDHVAPYRLGVNGRLIPSEREKARIAEEIRKRDEPLERERQQREEHARREAEALEEVERNYQETATINILGVQCHPDGRIVNP